MESNEDSKPVQAIREGFPVEHEGHLPSSEIEVDGRLVPLHESHPTGRVIREAAGAIPADEFILIQIADRETRSVALDERVDLREVERLRFRVFRDDRAFTFTLDGRGFEWGSELYSGCGTASLCGNPCGFRTGSRSRGGGRHS